MKYAIHFLFIISVAVSIHWSLASRSFSHTESSQPECFLCHESSFEENEFIMPWTHAFPECSGRHARGYVCSNCAREFAEQGIACPLCTAAEDETSNDSIQELLANQSRHQALRLARFNRQGRTRPRETYGDQEEPSR